MQIVKQLNLNKTPQAVPNGSLIYAKNIKLSSDGSYITQEEGIRSVTGSYEVDSSDINGNIIGVIPCSKELVIFTDSNYIYRYKEDNTGYATKAATFTPNEHNWTYSGGTLEGTYTYNVNNELIISVAEVSEEDKIPLRTAKFDSDGNLTFYDVSNELPISNMKLDSIVSGYTIPSGVYHFFIRYELDANQYSNWFPIGGTYYAVNSRQITLFNNIYNIKKGDNLLKLSRYANFPNEDAGYSFKFTITSNNIVGVKKCQIGYLLQKEDGVVGRINNKYDISNGSVSFIFNPDKFNIKDEDVNEFLENAFSIYNVGNICNYENRVYIANYEETEYNVNITPNIGSISFVRQQLSKAKYNVETITQKGYIWDINTDKTFDESEETNIADYRMPLLKYDSIINALNNNIEWSNPDSYIAEKPNIRYIAFEKSTISNNTITKTLYKGSDIYLKYYSHGGLITVDFVDSNGDSVVKFDDVYIYINYELDLDGNIVSYLGRIKLFLLSVTQETQYIISGNGNTTTSLSINIDGGYDYNVPTFMPEEDYNIFIHYVRKDGSYTNGIPVNKINTGTAILPNDEIPRYTFVANNIEIPDGYIGCFFSYEKEANNILYMGYCSSKIGNYGALFKASDVEIGAVGFKANFYKPLYTIDNNDNIVPVANSSWHSVETQAVMSNAFIIAKDGTNVNCLGKEGGVYVSLPNRDYSFVKKEVGIFKTLNTNNDNTRFSKSDKELIPIGGIAYAINGVVSEYSENAINSDFNYPAFVGVDRALIYNQKVYISDTDGQAYPIDENNIIGASPVTEPFASTINFIKYSSINLSAISIKKEPELIGSVYDKDLLARIYGTLNAEGELKLVGTVVKPINATDLIEIKSEYLPKNYKAYTNYNSDYSVSNIKTGTIRRSNVISDQSTENSWRIFRANQYKEIDKNKGRITNLVGVGNIFLIHTEHTLFMLDKTAFLQTENRNVQLETPDTFECTPQEVLTGTHGYGGLQFPYAWCVNHHGYWWYDNDNKKIYNFDAGKLNEVSKDICRLLENDIVNSASFGTDFPNDRVLMSFDINRIGQNTLSFNLYSGKFISLHDYFFNRAFNTKNNIYFMKKEHNGKYKALFTYERDYNEYIGYYSGVAILNIANRNKTVPCMYRVVTRQMYDPAVGHGVDYEAVVWAAYVDVIFNEVYETNKSLESVHWIVNQINYYNSNTSNDNMAEEDNDNSYDSDAEHYCGEMMQVYTDSTNSGILDVYLSSVVNLFNNYKYPYYDKGHWNLNYFRNMLKTDITEEELQKIANNLNVPVSRVKDGLITVTDGQGNLVYRYSDIRSLIYGKYIVTRFIFNMKVLTEEVTSVKHIKLENVWISCNKY